METSVEQSNFHIRAVIGILTLNKKSLHFIVWMSDFTLFLQLCHILSCLDVISWSKAKEESYFTPNSVCELHFSHFEVIPAIWKGVGCILKCNPDSHNLTTRLNCPSAILQWADWILCWDEKPNCYQITLTGTNSLTVSVRWPSASPLATGMSFCQIWVEPLFQTISVIISLQIRSQHKLIAQFQRLIFWNDSYELASLQEYYPVGISETLAYFLMVSDHQTSELNPPVDKEKPSIDMIWEKKEQIGFFKWSEVNLNLSPWHVGTAHVKWSSLCISMLIEVDMKPNDWNELTLL